MLMRKYGLYMAWIIALIATSGSLYMSEILLWEPCKLCWLQRICMYPLVVILGIAAYKNDAGVIRYALPLPIIGGSISIFHYMEQKIPGFAELTPCKVGIPCNYDYLDIPGMSWVTIPLLALIAFVSITVILIMVRKQQAAN